MDFSNFGSVLTRILNVGASVAVGLKQAHIGGQQDQNHYDAALMFLESLAATYQALTAPAGGTPVAPSA